MVNQMRTSESEMQYPDEDVADDVDDIAMERAETTVALHKQVQENVAIAHVKQRKDYAKRLGIGVKTFLFQEGDMVEKKNMRREGLMGDTLEALWMGPYKISNVDKQRVTLYDLRLKRDLKQTVAYDQLRPHLTGSPKLQGETSEPVLTPVTTPVPNTEPTPAPTPAPTPVCSVSTPDESDVTVTKTIKRKRTDDDNSSTRPSKRPG